MTISSNQPSSNQPASSQPSFGIPPTVLFREVDEQMVLLNVETEQYYGLNESGAAIVTRLINEPIDRALKTLASDYDVDPDVLRGDVNRLVTALVDAGLLMRAEGSEGVAGEAPA